MARCPKCNTENFSRFCPNCGNDMTAAMAAGQQVSPPYQPTLTPTPPAPPPQPYNPYGAPPYGTNPYMAPPERPATLWQGIVALVVSCLFAAFMGLALVGDDGELADALAGFYLIFVIEGLLLLPFGIWSLITNRTAGKVMSGCALALWVVMIAAIVAKYA